MDGKEHATQAEAPPGDAEPEEASTQPWSKRPRRALVVVVLILAALAALALGVVLFAPDGAEDGARDGEEARSITAEDGRPETSDEAVREAPERDGDVGPGDSPSGAASEEREPEPGAGPQDTAPGAGEATLPNLDIAPGAFRDRWNVAVRDLGRGYALDELDTGIPEEAAEPDGGVVEYPLQQSMDAFGFIEVRVRSDGVVASAVVEGEPTDAQQEEDYFATLAAAVAAVTGLSGQEAVDLLATDLGIDGTADPSSHVAGTEVDGVVIQIEAASGVWSFYIGGPYTG